MTNSDRRQALEDLRDQLTTAAKAADARELPAISRELRLLWEALDGLPDANGKASKPDQIAAKREQRRRKAAGE